jgi:transcriptional regulator with XRE-family HTH domain
MNITVNQLIKQMRLRRGLSLQEVADLVAKAAPPDKKPSAHYRQYISNIENGRMTPNWDSLEPIFAALGYRVAFVDLQPEWISTKDLEAALISDDDDALKRIYENITK